MYNRLFVSVKYGRDIDAVRGALAAGADPNFPVGNPEYNDTTVLHVAVSRARGSRAEKIDVLVRYPQAAHRAGMLAVGQLPLEL